ncbi:MAG: DUF5946 family protein [Planctomycetota bacterium]
MNPDESRESCIGCGAFVPAVDGPTHRYLEAAPGCWQLYGEVLSREYEDRAYWPSHRLTVDTYAVQHPGRPSPQSIRSVAVHLISLHLVLEREASPDRALRAIRAAVSGPDHFRWLEPPASMGPVTVVDAHAAVDAADHARRVRAWAESAWAAWSGHHEAVRAWVPRDA